MVANPDCELHAADASSVLAMNDELDHAAVEASVDHTAPSSLDAPPSSHKMPVAMLAETPRAAASPAAVYAATVEAFEPVGAPPVPISTSATGLRVARTCATQEPKLSGPPAAFS
jgi:hypothetical protein